MARPARQHSVSSEWMSPEELRRALPGDHSREQNREGRGRSRRGGRAGEERPRRPKGRDRAQTTQATQR
eukprot:6054582-Alexandrium_andersonii.AAC.1